MMRMYIKFSSFGLQCHQAVVRSKVPWMDTVLITFALLFRMQINSIFTFSGENVNNAHAKFATMILGVMSD